MQPTAQMSSTGSFANLILRTDTEKLEKEQKFKPTAQMSSTGSFPTLILRTDAEKLEKEQKFKNAKLRCSKKDIYMLERKLIQAYHELDKFELKQKEEENLWKGLESKFSSTEALTEEVIETLHLIGGVVRNAEQDKATFEASQVATSVVIDNLQDNMKALSLKLESSEETIRNCKRQLNELGIEKQKMENYFKVEQSKANAVIQEQDAKIKYFEATVAANGLAMDRLKSELKKLHLESRLKEDKLEGLRQLEKEKSDLVSKNRKFGQQLQMMREKKALAAQHAQQKFDKLQNQYTSVTSDKTALELANKDLKNEISTIGKNLEQERLQHAQQSQLAEEQIMRLESEIQGLHDDLLLSKLQGKLSILSLNSKLSENESLILKLSEKDDNIISLRKEIDKYIEKVDSLEKHASQINKLEEKDLLDQKLQDREKELEAASVKIQASLLAAESKLAETKRQYDQIERKMLEISRDLNDSHQAICEIRRTCDLEKLKSFNLEKEKADKNIGEMKRDSELEQLECTEESKQQLEHIWEEHAALETNSMRNEHEAQSRALRLEHEEGRRRLQKELDIQKPKEEKKRSRSQLELKIIGADVEEQEVTSKKVSISRG